MTHIRRLSRFYQWTHPLRDLYQPLVPLLPLATLASVSSGAKFSALIIGGLLLSAAILWRARTPIPLQLMPIITLSAVAYGVDGSTAIFTGAVAGFALWILSFTPWMVPLLKLVPANVVAGMNAAIAAVLLERGLASFRVFSHLREISLANILWLTLGIVVVASALALVLRGKTAIALTAIFLLTAITKPGIFLHFRPDFPLHLSFPPLNSVMTTLFPYLLPEFFYTGIAAVVAGARLTAHSQFSFRPEEFIPARIAGGLATLAACPIGFIPPVPSLAPSDAPSPAAQKPSLLFLVAFVSILSVAALSGWINALPHHLPAYLIPGLYLVAAWPFIDSLRIVTHSNDRMVVLATTLLVFMTRSFGWTFIGGLFAFGLVRMVRGESPLSFPPQELRYL